MYRKIFVILEPGEETQPALDRAAFLARATGANLSLFLCAYDTAISIASFLTGSQQAGFIRTMLDGNRMLVERLAAPLREEGIEVESEVVWDRHPVDAALKALEGVNADLVMKFARPVGIVREVVFNQMDFHLMRYSKCPVMLVKTGQWDDVGQVLAAVHPSVEPPHQQLNRVILDTARHLANTLHFELHVATAYPPPPVFAPVATAAQHAVNYRLKMSAMVKEAVDALAVSYDIPREHRHYREGPVDWVIPQVSAELVAEFVVLGNVARQGLAGKTLGTSAESTLDQLNTNVLLVPPS